MGSSDIQPPLHCGTCIPYGLVALSFQPIAAALFSVRDTYIAFPGSIFDNHFRVPLLTCSLGNKREQSPSVGFLGASGLASASIVYGLGDPEFIHDGYTVGAFEVQ